MTAVSPAAIPLKSFEKHELDTILASTAPLLLTDLPNVSREDAPRGCPRKLPNTNGNAVDEGMQAVAGTQAAAQARPAGAKEVVELAPCLSNPAAAQSSPGTGHFLREQYWHILQN